MKGKKVELTVVQGHGLMIDGQETARSDVLAAAREWLIDHGHHPLDVDGYLVDRSNLVQRAWWAGPAVGFCSEQHPDAAPVTVINLPVGLTASAS